MQQADPTATKRPVRAGYRPAEVRRALWYILVAWGFGATFASLTSGASLTSFLVKYLKADDFSYGLIMAIGPAAGLFQFFGSYIIERTGRTKRNFLIFATTHRLLWLGVAAVPLLLPHASSAVRLTVVGVLIFLSGAAANFGGAGWPAWMAEIVPQSLAGKYFGYRARLGMIAMMVSSIAVSYLLDANSGSAWLYAGIFALAALIGAVDILLFIPVREIPRQTEDQLPTLVEICATPWKDPLFRGYALYTAVAWISYMMMGPFCWRYCFAPVAEQGLGLSMFWVNLLLFLLPMVAMAWMAPYWGAAIDRFGPKPVLGVCSLCAIIIPVGWLILHREVLWLLPIMALLGGLSWPGIEQILFYMQLKGFPQKRRTAYSAMSLVVFSLACMVGTALGGVIATFWQHYLHYIPGLPAWLTHYHPLFLTSLVLRVAAFVFLFPPLRLTGSADKRTVAKAIAHEVRSSLPQVRRQPAKAIPAAPEADE